MSSWLDPLRRVLDTLPCSRQFFIRNDDAGWADDQLESLLAIVERTHVGIDLAVIPTALNSRNAATLLAWHERANVRLHQHGLRHVNHESAGRKCEFGASRSIDDLHHDVALGQRLMHAYLGGAVDSVFTPPWNRSSNQLGEALAACELRVLSRDRTAGALRHDRVVEVPVTFDWFAKRDGVALTHEQRGERLAEEFANAAVPGIMLHHAVTDTEHFTRIAELLALLGSHPNCRASTIVDVAMVLVPVQ